MIVDGERLPMVLADLPCTVETHKTIDQTEYFKTGDVGQIILVGLTAKREQKLIEEDTYGFRSGITSPSHEIRRKVWAEKPPEDLKDAELEAIRLTKGGIPNDVTLELVDPQQVAHLEDYTEEIIPGDEVPNSPYNVASPSPATPRISFSVSEDQSESASDQPPPKKRRRSSATGEAKPKRARKKSTDTGETKPKRPRKKKKTDESEEPAPIRLVLRDSSAASDAGSSTDQDVVMKDVPSNHDPLPPPPAATPKPTPSPKPAPKPPTPAKEVPENPPSPVPLRISTKVPSPTPAPPPVQVAPPITPAPAPVERKIEEPLAPPPAPVSLQPTPEEARRKRELSSKIGSLQTEVDRLVAQVDTTRKNTTDNVVIRRRHEALIARNEKSIEEHRAEIAKLHQELAKLP